MAAAGEIGVGAVPRPWNHEEAICKAVALWGPCAAAAAARFSATGGVEKDGDGTDIEDDAVTRLWS